MQEGDLCYLLSEPDNKYDKYAVQVFLYSLEDNAWWFVGYLPRGSGISAKSAILAKVVSGGRVVSCDELIPRNENMITFYIPGFSNSREAILDSKGLLSFSGGEAYNFPTSVMAELEVAHGISPSDYPFKCDILRENICSIRHWVPPESLF